MTQQQFINHLSLLFLTGLISKEVYDVVLLAATSNPIQPESFSITSNTTQIRCFCNKAKSITGVWCDNNCNFN